MNKRTLRATTFGVKRQMNHPSTTAIATNNGSGILQFPANKSKQLLSKQFRRYRSDIGLRNGHQPNHGQSIGAGWAPGPIPTDRRIAPQHPSRTKLLLQFVHGWRVMMAAFFKLPSVPMQSDCACLSIPVFNWNGRCDANLQMQHGTITLQEPRFEGINSNA